MRGARVEVAEVTASQPQLPTIDTARLPRPWTIDGLVTRGDARRWALFSPCGRYRYALSLAWDERPLFDVVCLNPSTADHLADDPTFRKLRHIAVRNSCGGLLIRNIAALRATDPDAMWRNIEPVGPSNLMVLRFEQANSIKVAAWGRLSRAQRLRVKESLEFAERYCTHALRVGKDGDPSHPLYLPNATNLVPFGRGAA